MSKIAFVNLDLVAIDIPVAQAALNKIEDTYEIYFLTSRPERTRKEVMEYLKQHRLLGLSRWLLMKPDGADIPGLRSDRMSGLVWKLNAIHLIAGCYGASDILVIDTDSILLSKMEESETSYIIRGYADLALATNDHPF